MIKLFKLFTLNEIAESEVVPKIIWKDINYNDSIYRIIINNKYYEIKLEWIYVKCKEYNLCSGPKMLRVDFFSMDSNREMTDDLTNYGNAIEVLSNVVAVVKLHLLNDKFSNIILTGIKINSKSEIYGDTRIKNIYEYYLKKSLKKMGIEIIKEKTFPSKSPNYLTIYRTERIRLGDLKTSN